MSCRARSIPILITSLYQLPFHRIPNDTPPDPSLTIMRRRVNKPFSIPRQAGAEGPLQFPKSPQPHSNGLIDEKLIQGSQVSSSSSSLYNKFYRQENGTLPYQPGSTIQLPALSTPIQQDEVFEDEDVQLDAFGEILSVLHIYIYIYLSMVEDRCLTFTLVLVRP